MDDKFVTENEVKLLLAQSKSEVMSEVWKDRGDIQVNSSAVSELKDDMKEIKDMIMSNINWQKAQMAALIIGVAVVIATKVIG